MDIKTLEYMSERVDKARELTKAINQIEERIKFIKTKSIASLRFDTGDTYSYIGKHYMSIPDNSIVSHIKEATINCLETYRDSLQKELDEL